MLTSLAMNGGAVVVAFILAAALGLRERASQFLFGTLCGLLVVVHSIVLGAGLAGHLTVGGLSIGLATALAGVLGLARGVKRGRETTEPGLPFTAAALFAPLTAVLSGAVWAWPHLFEATRLWVWDDYTYHMVYPALWLRDHAIAAVAPAQAFTMQAWYPLSASLVATWFMVPFPGLRGEALAWVSFTGLLYATMVASGSAEVLGRLGCRRGAWAVPVVLVATSDRIGVMASSFSDADLAQAAALFAALVFAVPRGDVESPSDVRVDTWYAGLLSGIALGVKVSAAVPALIILVMIALRARASSASWRMTIRTPLVFALSWAVTGGYWYARNIVHTGNPLYPAAFLLWPGATFPQTTLVEYSRQYGLRRTIADALVVYMDWPPLHAGLAVAGLIGLAAWLAWHRLSLRRSQAYGAVGALVIAGSMLIVLPAMPYSAGNAMTFRSGLIHWDSMRYIALLPILGWVALGFVVDAGVGASRWRTFAAVLITTAAVLTARTTSPAFAIVLVASVLCAMVLAGVQPRAEGRRARTVAVAAAAAVTAGIIVWSYGAKAAATTAAFYREPLFGRAAAVLDVQPPGTRVSVFGDPWVYPTFGAANDLVPVRLDGDGRVATMPIGAAFGPGDLTVAPSTFRANLGASGIGLVVVVHLPHPGRSAQWPTQQAALETIADARLLYRDGAVAIWRLGP